MASAVASEVASTANSSITPWTVSYPSGIVAGDLLLAIAANAVDANPFIWPAGWTDLAQGDNSGGDTLGVAYRIADGSEGASFSLDLTLPRRGACRVFRITGSDTPPAASVIATGQSTSPDPASLTPGFTADLWFAACCHEDFTNTLSAYPASYTNGTHDVNDSGSTASSIGLGIARRSTSATTENPGAFTIGTSRRWNAYTVAIKAAVSSTPVATTRDVKYSIRNAVTPSRQIVYSIKNSVTSARAVKYNVVQAIAGTRSVKYSIRNSVLATRQLLYGIKNAVTPTREVVYSIYQQIPSTRDLEYSIVQAIGASREITYTISEAIPSERDLLYGIHNAVTSERELVYSSYEAITDTRDLTYTIVAWVTSSRALVYSIDSATVVAIDGYADIHRRKPLRTPQVLTIP